MDADSKPVFQFFLPLPLRPLRLCEKLCCPYSHRHPVPVLVGLGEFIPEGCSVSKKPPSRPSAAPMQTSADSPLSRRRFGRELWGTAAVLVCGAGFGAWWM